MDERKVLLSLHDVEVKFKVRGKELNAIRGVDLDIYEGETLAIVGESGSGKSVLTKTFSGMLDSNGYISNGKIILNDDEVADTKVKMTLLRKCLYDLSLKLLNSYHKYENASNAYNELEELKEAQNDALNLPFEEEKAYLTKKEQLENDIVEQHNTNLLFDRKYEKDLLKKGKAKLKELQKELKSIEKEHEILSKQHRKNVISSEEYQTNYVSKINGIKTYLKNEYKNEYDYSEVEARNEKLAKEIVLSTTRYSFNQNIKLSYKLIKALKLAMKQGKNLEDEDTLNEIFEKVNFRVKYIEDTKDGCLHGYAVLNLAKVRMPSDWQKIRGSRIATVFQDPMTSLNPVITIGKQITNVIMKHQNLSKQAAKEKAIEMMKAVGITDPRKRFNDYPFQYSGGMRQRIVIAIALSCAPKILICDEPTTALDVTIQAQILKLIKKLQNELHFTTIYITHDLGVVANVAERVAVLYAGKIIEYGKVEEIFYEPAHPYTWALLSSLPQLSVIGEKLYSIEGTPPSLYNKIKGDAFAPRNPHCMKIDFVKEPPMFKITDTHYARTWLLDPRAPKVEKPKNIQNLHETLSHSIYTSFNKEEDK
jgi:oligopeptide transport system ATP-binding protein